MKETSPQNLLSACCDGRRVTVGLEPAEELRALSDERRLTCPGCGGAVVLHAGAVRAHHFAHLPGAVCSLPQTEPETEEHRAGKLLLARWLRERLPESEIVVEAFLPETGQRADVLALVPESGRSPRRIAFEYQCANLSAREWRRRSRLYRAANIEDLWILGGSRLVLSSGGAVASAPPRRSSHSTDANEPPELRNSDTSVSPNGADHVRSLRTTELERALLWDGAPLLFLDSLGLNRRTETLARFRPDPDTQALHPVGRLSAKPLLSLEIPWALLDWPSSAHPDSPLVRMPVPTASTSDVRRSASGADWWLWEWLKQRFRVTPETLPDFFGLPVAQEATFACESRTWQAAVYYRFAHTRVGDAWWLEEVETWARAYLPLTQPVRLRRLRAALETYQNLLAAAGILSLPRGYGRSSARVLADLTTLSTPPDAEEVLRLAQYRRTLLRENRAAYR